MFLRLSKRIRTQLTCLGLLLLFFLCHVGAGLSKLGRSKESAGSAGASRWAFRLSLGRVNRMVNIL
jgi:hypothetical protein